MKQRVAIARAFATDADLILMDEPFVSLDQPTREKMQREVLDIWEQRKRTMIFVTHNLEEAVFLGDRVLMLSTKPARIVADIADKLPRPRDPLSREDFTALRSQLCGDPALHPFGKSWREEELKRQPEADSPRFRLSTWRRGNEVALGDRP